MPGGERIDSLFDKEAIQAEFSEIEKMLEKLGIAISSGKAVEANMKVAQSLKDRKSATKDLMDQQEKLLTADKNLEQQMTKTIEVTKQQQQQKLKSKQISDEELRTQVALQLQRQKQIADIKDEIRLNQAAEGSLAQKRLELKKLQQQYDNLSESQKKSQAGIDLHTQLQAKDKDVKTEEFGTGRFGRNVGNYSGALKTLEGALVSAKAQLNALTETQQQNTSSGQKLQEEVSLLTTLVNQQSHGFASLTMEVRAGERALQTMRAAGLEDTETFQKLRVEVANAHRQMNEFNKQQKLIESEAPNLQAGIVAAKGLSGIYATGAGAAALFADGNEKVEKELNKLVAIMTILQGLQEVNELLHQKNAIALVFENTVTKIATAANRVWAATMLESTVATVAFRVALISITGGLFLLIPLLASGYTKIAEAAKQAKMDQELLNEVNKKAIDIYASEEIKIKDVLSQLKNENVSHGEKYKLIEELKNQYPDYLDGIKNEGKLTSDLSDAITTKLIPALELEAKAKAAQELASEKYKKLLQLQQDPSDAVGFWDKLTEAAKQYGMGLEQASKNVAKKDIKELQGQIDDLFKISMDAENELSKLGKGKAEDKKLLEEEIKFRIELINLIRKQAAEDQKAIASMKELPAFSRIDALKKAYALETAIIKSQSELELRNTKLTAGQRAVIIEKANLQLLAKEREFTEGVLRARGEELVKERDLEKQFAEDLAAAEEKKYKKAEETAQKQFASRKANLQEARDYELKFLSEQHGSGKLNDSDYDKKRKESEVSTNDFILKADEDLVRKQIKLAESQGQDTSELYAKLAGIELQIEENKDNEIIKKRKDRADKVKKIINEEQGYQEDAEKSIVALVDAGYEREVNRLQRQINQNDKLRDAEVKRVADSTIAEQQKAATIQVLNARTEATNAALIRKQNQEKEKQAKFDRDKSVFDVVSNTIGAIWKTNAELGWPAAIPEDIALAAKGAADLVALLAHPLPKFAGGTKSAPRGFGIWGEAGTEAKIDRSGNVQFADKATLSYMHGGERIVSNPELRKIGNDLDHMMYAAMLSKTAKSISTPTDDRVVKELRKQNDILNRQSEIIEETGRQKQPIIIKNDLGKSIDFAAHIKKQVFD
jgi:hypothetical protein